MSCVLIVEDETITRAILARVVGTIDGITALAVGSVQEALAVLEVAKPDIAIVDLHLQDGLGFEVLKALDEKGGVAMAVVISAHLHEHERALSAVPGRLRCMAKPIDYGELKRTLAVASSTAARFHGPLTPVEYVQIAGAGRHSVRLSCYEPTGELVGHVAVVEGRVWSAGTRQLTGLAALGWLSMQPELRVRLDAASQLPGLANVDRDWQVAMLDALALGGELSREGNEAESRAGGSLPPRATPRSEGTVKQ
jgi:ActR/RegA family two-component response regulator